MVAPLVSARLVSASLLRDVAAAQRYGQAEAAAGGYARLNAVVRGHYRDLVRLAMAEYRRRVRLAHGRIAVATADQLPEVARLLHVPWVLRTRCRAALSQLQEGGEAACPLQRWRFLR